MPARLVVYFPLGDPAIGPDLLDLYANLGVDVVECGWPASDPYLDGPDVRASMARALPHDPGAAWSAVREWLAGRGGPSALLMTYVAGRHPGLEDPHFFSGAYGVLAVASPGDLAQAELEARARASGAAVCAFLPDPLTEPDIVKARAADGYVMLQAAPGLTGPRPSLDPVNAKRIARLRDSGVSAPILLGFGVSKPEHARMALALGADGVVVGSAALRAALQGSAALAALLKGLRRGLDG
jgi:tryptophan synthase alpha chain